MLYHFWRIASFERTHASLHQSIKSAATGHPVCGADFPSLLSNSVMVAVQTRTMVTLRLQIENGVVMIPMYSMYTCNSHTRKKGSSCAGSAATLGRRRLLR